MLPGWKQGRPVRASVLLMCLLSMTVHATEAEEIPEGFLEFLGMMVEQDGELIDPLTLGRLSDSTENADGGRPSMDSQVQGDGQAVDVDPSGDGNQGSEGDPDE